MAKKLAITTAVPPTKRQTKLNKMLDSIDAEIQEHKDVFGKMASKLDKAKIKMEAKVSKLMDKRKKTEAKLTGESPAVASKKK